MACSTLRSGMATLAAIATTVMLLPATNAAIISKIDAVPAGWTVASSSAAGKTFKTENTDTGASADTHVFTIALNLQNIDQLESRLLAVSTPGHASYGQFVDVDGITATFGPSADAVSAVTSWLESSGVVKSYVVRDGYVDLATDVAGANKLFGADYQYYTPPSTASTTAAATSTKLRTLSYSVPDDIAAHVALVDPGNYFGGARPFAPRLGDMQFGKRAVATPDKVKNPRKGATKTTIDAACQTSITPACLKQLYQVGDYAADASSGSRIGFGSFLGQSALYEDLADYLKLNGLPAQNFSVELINNGTNDQNPTTAQIGEADLDAQNIVGVAHPLPVVEYITGGSPPFVPNIDQPTPANNSNEPYLPYYRYLLSKTNAELPQVISNSYGDEEDSVPYNYAVHTCNLIGLLGLRGITVIESSGDLGVGAGCLAPDYKTPEFNAIFPATCPYLTSVGGTVDVTPEIAWDGSSGGFSSYFPRPAWQALAVGAYLAEHVSASTYEYYGHYTNWHGRGFPDVSAHSVSPDYQIVYAGTPGPSGGTSAAAPVWAAIVGLLNDARLRKGLPTLGWLNPLLYTFGPQVLTDITAGQAVGCNGQNTQSGGAEPAGSGVIPGAFWNATTGWDPVTGYGTPNFGKLLSLVTGF
ncbi:hypothetical protein HMPREF1624_08802 [Sporothrix schenckii ATCC 58251]|uniref:tripeptidyl-peptidase II n=1 Tax=Sporothrix schenckii (strain ATCC 58251 / de Perez 2211183) TaxID=1391915 RepID=U7PJM5_SPOS1|nr:hypothetical protein HMPREF1624_08802 [Sporothrix schenckii ATCC 58251]